MMNYQRQLCDLVKQLALPGSEASVSGLDNRSQTLGVQMFVDGNVEKRLDKLERQLEFVLEVFPDFEQLVIDYCRTQPLAAFDTGSTDGERMLDWIQHTKSLSDVQRDYVACQKARHAIEEIARVKRREYLAFQQRSQQPPSHDELVHLNPVLHWTRFHSDALLDDAATPPVNVLFFAGAGDIGTAVLELEGQALLNELAELAPCYLEQWAALSQLAEREQLARFVDDLRGMGLVA